MTGRTLIVYSTKSGINEEAAVEMANVLKTTSNNKDVTVADLREGQPDIASFQNIIVGGGVRERMVYREAMDFLAHDFSGKNVAIYFSCEDSEIPKMETVEEDAKKVLMKNPSLKPVAVSGFGGCMFLDGRPALDEKSLARVRDWASELGRKFDDQMEPKPQMAMAATTGGTTTTSTDTTTDQSKEMMDKEE